MADPRRSRAIAALLQAKDLRAAAAAAGVGERTLRRWVAEDKAFRSALAAAERDVVTAASRRLGALLGTALDALHHLLVSSEDDSVRLRAAQSVMELALRYRTATDIEERLSKLEGDL